MSTPRCLSHDGPNDREANYCQQMNCVCQLILNKNATNIVNKPVSYIGTNVETNGLSEKKTTKKQLL